MKAANFSQRYTLALKASLADTPDKGIAPAALGREASEKSIELWQVLEMHHLALGECLRDAGAQASNTRAWQNAQQFLEQVLTGFAERPAAKMPEVGVEWSAAPTRTGTLVSLVQRLEQEVNQRRQAEEQLNRFFGCSLNLHCIIGFDGILQRVNLAWERSLGYSTNELLGRPFWNFVLAEHRATVRKQLQSLKQSTEPVAFEIQCGCKDGSSKWTLWNATPVPEQHIIVAAGRDITQRRRAEEALRQSEEHYRELFHEAFRMQQDLRQLSARVLQLQEQERAHLSRELHDEVGQALTAVSVNLAAVKRDSPADAVEIHRRIDDAHFMLELTMDAVHRCARELRPAMLDDLGLVPALRTYIKGFTTRTGIQVVVRGSTAAEGLNRECKTVAYRAVQEALTNVARHSGATRVEISLRKEREILRIEIHDNGKGFSRPPVASGSECLGLMGIQERARLVNGSFTVRSRPGKGATLIVCLPFVLPQAPAAPKA